MKMNDMKRLCFFAIAALLAAGCGKEAGPTGGPEDDGILVGDGPGKMTICINQDDDYSLCKSFLDLDYINSCYVLIGPYTNGVYGEPVACVQSKKKFTLIGLEEGRVYIAVVINPESEPKDVPSLEEFNGGKWYFKNFTGQKGGIGYADIVRDRTVWADVTAKRCYCKIYIEKVMDSSDALMTPMGNRDICLDEIYLQNIPAFSYGHIWGWEKCMPNESAAGEDNWFNPSGTIGRSSNTFINSMTSVESNNKYNHSFSDVNFFLPPNTTSRKTRLVIHGHYSVNEPESAVKECYYTINLPDFKPNTFVRFKKIEIVGIGGESPDDYAGQSNVKYSMSIGSWTSGASVEEQF